MPEIAAVDPLQQWTALGTETAQRSPVRSGRLHLAVPGGRRIALDSGFTVGKARDNRLVLEDSCVSRHHLAIDVTSGQVRVRDLNSKNGTFVNGVRVSVAELSPGTVIGLGNARLRVTHAPASDTPILGESASIAAVRQQVSVLAPTELSVLILGETGSGKELIARALHDQSGRAGAFVPLNCGAIPKELVESELFGHERGAFTGALARRDGVFQEADGGTLFLDEVGELPAALQPRLLRALESGVVKPVGANREQRVSVRIVAATHVDLKDAAARGAFRQDLYFRLAAASITSPPLRSRPSDIAELARHVLEEEVAASGPCVLTPDALFALEAHPWPGNIRELKNVLRRAAALGGPTLDVSDLELQQPLGATAPEDDDGVRVAGRPYLEIEREVLERTIRRHGGNKRAAALALRIPKSTLCDKAKRYGIG
jgi:DNA-binding NtrC family response regulator